MENLPTEVLTKIIQYLPHRERLRVERVCSRWRAASQKAWEDIHALRFVGEFQFRRYKSDNSVYLHKFVAVNDSELCIGLEDFEVIEELVSRTGVNIQKISIGKPMRNYESRHILSILSTYCRNIEFLEMEYAPALEDACARLLEVNRKMHSIMYYFDGIFHRDLPNLNWKELSLCIMSRTDEDRLVSIIRQSPSLESFTIEQLTSRIGEALTQCANLRSLHFFLDEASDETVLQSVHLIPMLNHLTSLIIVIIEIGPNWMHDSLPTFLQRCVNLREFRLEINTCNNYSSIIL